MGLLRGMKGVLAVGVLLLAAGTAAGVQADDRPGRVSFTEDIHPIIQFRCLACHQEGSEGAEMSGLNLETYEGLMKGTKYGPVIVPGNSMVSNLNVMIEGRAAIRMPHNKKRLSPCEIKMFQDWVNQGAKNN